MACRGCHPYKRDTFRMLQGLCNDCNPSHTLLLGSALLRFPPLSGEGIKDTRVQPIISNDSTKHWPSPTMQPDFFFPVCTVLLLITSRLKARLVFSVSFGSVSHKMDQGAFKDLFWKPRSIPFGTFWLFFFSHMKSNCYFIFQRLERFCLSPTNFNLVGKYYSVLHTSL